jgi:hypothetical protein
MALKQPTSRSAAVAERRTKDLHQGGTVLIRFNLVGLILFSVALLVVGGLLSSGVLNRGTGAGKEGLNTTGQGSAGAGLKPDNIPPWGELIVREIEVERPEEYLASEATTNPVPAWVFEHLKPDQVRPLLVSCGLSSDQAARALAAERVSVSPAGTVIHPDDELVYSLTREVRAKLYHELSRWPANHYMCFPFCFRQQTVEGLFENSNLDDTVVTRIKKLLYERGNAECFSDFEVVMRSLPSDRERIWLTKALSRQRALLVRLRIRPDADIDKLLGYWDRGVQVKDARPLLEAVRRLPEGGTISLMYLLPTFARERLYTFPMPPKAGEPPIDCHWTTMNFFNERPDNRFADPQYTVQYLKTNYYRVAKATLYGDVVFVLNKEGNAIHSAVYLADDIVFTKNGNNYEQPWMLVRIKDLLATYSSEPVQVAVYRNNKW